ncbi:leucyl/phenylalanyl-tRNA--protein transferase [Stakelama sediminis]|uniref:Leucyl/phenylalanyl-tRNA--protein transferase n=1 Tax=Stakelama sediminis TaxID=463200 RepID=A0A840YUY0_9SPHN|nr:leucyl/phenylalanyl-tRNA--protein transferase [Stakelama sediminis]MBB5717392.1 leucyl/phenylalanyl-tRNA--protein transferase [Stakelama sediminis]
MHGPDLLDPNLVLRAYAMGVFPMADHRDAGSVYWVEPKQRGILPLDRFHLSRSLRKTIARDRFTVTADKAFDRIITLCAEAAADRPDTWINGAIEKVFLRLHDSGHAHSIECWQDGELVGGLYGLALGRAFFGESMVSRARDASKVALAWLVARLKVGGYRLLDCQFQTDHLESLGAVEIPRDDYMLLLADALGTADGEDPAAGVADDSLPSPDFFRLDALAGAAGCGAFNAASSEPPLGKDIAQLLGQTSYTGS